MKVEQTENSIKLVAETDFERECLKRLRSSTIKSKEFEDSWNQRGPLVISFPTVDEHYNGWGRL